MSTIFRPRRSALYMPASNARALEKARTLASDVLIFDLEDAVLPEAKISARSAAAKAVWEGEYGNRELVIRVNRLDTPWGLEDIHAAAAAAPQAILLPKVESPAEVNHALMEMEKAGARADTQLWCMIETPRGIMNVEDIAFSSSRLGCLVMGLADLTKDLRAANTPDRLPVLYALSRSVNAARAASLDILDGVHTALDDEEGLARHCLQAKELGFDGKTLIHPSQIDTANTVFAPSPAEIVRAREIIAAFDFAQQNGKGIAVLHGHMVENLHVHNARRLIALSEALGV